MLADIINANHGLFDSAKLTQLGLKVEIRNNRMVIRLPGDVLFASEYVYSPFGISSCDPSFDTYYPQPYGYEGMTYDPAMPAEVQIVSNVTLTFAIA